MKHFVEVVDCSINVLISGMRKFEVEAVNFLWKQKHFNERGWKLEVNSEAKVLKRSWKRKQFSQNQALPDFETGYNRWGKM